VLTLGAHEIALTPGVWRIGRDPTCELRLSHDSVSRRHATLRVEAGKVELQDHGSRNGVRVNGERVIGKRLLRVGDAIRVGTEELRLDARPADAPVINAPTKPMPRVESKPPEPTGLSLLSPREREVLEGVARGETQRAIAERLGLSVKTVETYSARIREKLELKSRADMVRFALDAGLLG